MDSPDLELVYKNHQKQHKLNPVTIIGELAQKRREFTQISRKSYRFTQFDNRRELLPNQNQQQEPSPRKLTDNELKVQQRRQQLEKWKEEKEKQKREELKKKKKPFLVAPKATIPVVPPPIPPKAGPSTFKRVTRAQARANNDKIKENAIKTKYEVPVCTRFTGNYSAMFKIPLITFTRPTVEEPVAVSFEPIIKESLDKRNCEPNKRKTEANVTKPGPKPRNPSKKPVQQYCLESSSSSSSIEKPDIKIKRTARDINQNKGITKPLPPKKVINQKVEKEKVKEPIKENKKLTKAVTEPQETQKRSIRSTRSQSQVITKSEKQLAKANKADKLQVKKTKTVAGIVTVSEISPKVNKTTENLKVSKVVTTPISVIPRSESSSEEKLRQTNLSPDELRKINTSISSPAVTISRGKDSARKEMKMKMKEGLLDEDTSKMENVSIFRLQLNSEISRMNQLSDMWEKTLEENDLPVFVQEQILSAVGLARLLISSKLKQFEGLVRRCEEGDVSGGLVTPADLQGFWDMVFIQIVNVDMKFKELDQLRSNNWEEVVPTQKPKEKGVRAAKPKPIQAQSKLKDIIAARRKANTQLETKIDKELKTFEGGFFRVTSPIRSPAEPATPNNNSMLKNVLSTEAKKASVKKANTSMAMLRASLFGKGSSSLIEGIAPLPLTPTMTPINLKATPARSILKSAKKDLTRAKLSKSVLFNESDLEQNEDKENYYQANQVIQDAVNSQTSKEKDTQREKVERKSNKPLKRQDAFSTDSPVQRAAKVKAMKAIDKLRNKPTPRKTTPKTPNTPKLGVNANVDGDTPRRSERISMRVIN